MSTIPCAKVVTKTATKIVTHKPTLISFTAGSLLQLSKKPPRKDQHRPLIMMLGLPPRVVRLEVVSPSIAHGSIPHLKSSKNAVRLEGGVLHRFSSPSITGDGTTQGNHMV